MKATKIVVIALLLVALILAAIVIYRQLSDKYAPQSVTPNTETSESASESAEDSTAAENENAAPDFTVYTQDGTAVSLSDFAGKPVIVNFWASWCGPCKSELPHFNDLYAEYGDRVEFMMVNLDGTSETTMADVASYVSGAGYTFPVYYDLDNASSLYSLVYIPVTVVIDADGNIVETYTGSMTEAQLTGYIETLLGE